MSTRRRLLIVRHVPWEGPHRLSRVMADLSQQVVDVLEGDPLPDPTELAGAVIMGGPMSVHDDDRYPRLEDERDWIERALFCELPLLGVCLGSQMIAGVLGASVTRALEPEIGWAPITVIDHGDPLVGPLAPTTNVLHWHGEEFPTPPGARCLARSSQAACQAFRHENAWGLLFHMEADEPLLSSWLAIDTMKDEAQRALGEDYRHHLQVGARSAQPDLIERSTLGIDAFAGLVRARGERT